MTDEFPDFTHDETGISTGDVVVHLRTGSALQVVSRATQPAGEHPETRFDATSEMFDGNPEELVYNCVYLPGGDHISSPSNTYACPESQLLRYPVEDAVDCTGSIQTWLRTAFLSELADGIRRAGNDKLRRKLTSLVEDVYTSEIAEHFEQLIDASDARAEEADR